MEKVIDIEERIPSMREKRRKTTNRKFVFILMIFIIALLIILYFRSPFSRINGIIVTGAVLHDQTLYIDRSGLSVDESFWGFTINDVEKKLEEIEGVKSASISRKWLRDVEITISEWGAVAYVEDGGHYSLLMENGEMLSTDYLLLTDEAPILNGFNNPDREKRMTDQLTKMDPAAYALISEIIYKGTKENPDRITVYMDDGFEVRAFISSFAEKMEYYPEIIAQLQGQEKGVLDIEVGTFFKPYSKVYGPEEEDEVVVEEDE